MGFELMPRNKAGEFFAGFVLFINLRRAGLSSISRFHLPDTQCQRNPAEICFCSVGRIANIVLVPSTHPVEGLVADQERDSGQFICEDWMNFRNDRLGVYPIVVILKVGFAD
jgi:hypothetical protein